MLANHWKEIVSDYLCSVRFIKDETERFSSGLTPRQWEVLCMFHGLDCEPEPDLSIIATRLGVTRETVSRHKYRADSHVYALLSRRAEIARMKCIDEINTEYAANSNDWNYLKVTHRQLVIVIEKDCFCGEKFSSTVKEVLAAYIKEYENGKASRTANVSMSMPNGAKLRALASLGDTTHIVQQPGESNGE